MGENIISNDGKDGGHRRMRSLLRNYYGIGEEETKVKDPLNIDADSFESQTFLLKELQSKNLNQLMKSKNSLLKDVRELDSGMKTLVYENYNKFISATDTIRLMKNNVSEMEDEMQRLKRNLEEISQCTESISKSLRPNREKIANLSGISSLLTKRQFLFELPARLTKCVETGSYHQAVKYYTGSRNILDKYKDLPSFNSIHSDSEIIIGKLKIIIEQKLNSGILAKDKLVEYTSLLIDLKEPVAPLLTNYVNLRTKDIQTLIDNYTKLNLPNLNFEIDEHDNKVVAIIGGLVSLNSQQIEINSKTTVQTNEQGKLIKFIVHYHQLLSRFIREISEFTDSFNNLFLLKEKDEKIISQYKLILESSFQSLFKSIISLLNLNILSLDPIHFLLFLEYLQNQFKTINENHLLMMPKRSIAIQKSIITSYIQKDFDATKLHLQKILSTLEERAKKRNNDVDNYFHFSAVEAAKSISSSIVHFIYGAQDFFAKREQNHFITKLVGDIYSTYVNNIEQLCNNVNKICFEYEKKLEDDPKKSQLDLHLSDFLSFLLMLSRVCLELKEKFLSQINEASNQLINLIQLIIPHHALPSIPRINFDQLQKNLLLTTQKILSSYMRYQGTQISQMIKKGVEARDWTKEEEPREVRPVIYLVLKEVDIMFSILSEVLDTDNLLNSNQGDQSQRDKKVLRSSLFDQKVKIVGVVSECTSSVVLEGVLKIFLKSFSEYIRLKTFSKFGVQQIQVDVHFLRVRIMKYLKNNNSQNVIERMLKEVIQSSSDRCFDSNSILLDNRVVEHIYEKAIQNQSFVERIDSK